MINTFVVLLAVECHAIVTSDAELSSDQSSSGLLSMMSVSCIGNAITASHHTTILTLRPAGSATTDTA